MAKTVNTSWGAVSAESQRASSSRPGKTSRCKGAWLGTNRWQPARNQSANVGVSSTKTSLWT